MSDDDRAEALRQVHGVLATITAAPSMRDALQALADGVVAAVGFGVVCVNVVDEDGRLRAVAVAGSEDARHTLMGRRYERAQFEAEFARADAWGRLLFVPHDRVHDREDLGWVPAWAPSDDIEAWNPLDALFAPMHAASGELIGVLSVDLPRGGRRPGPVQRDLLELVAAYAGLTLERLRLTEQLREEQDRLRASDEAFRLAFHGAAVGMLIISLSGHDVGRFRAVNAAMCRIAGRSAEEIVGQPLSLITHPDDLARDLQALTDAVAGRIDVYRTEKRYVRPDGSLVWGHATASVIRDGQGRALYGVTHVEDITDRRTATLALEHRATHDQLTGLVNRAALEQHLQALLDAGSRRPARAALLFCDLDRFKRVNDRHGHLVGDQVLRHVAARLLTQARSGDLVARLGGDEFVVVAEGIDKTEADAFAQRIRAALAGPVTVGDLLLDLQVSIGVTTVGDARSAHEVLAAADAAMYAAKREPPDAGASGAPGHGS